MMESLAIKAMVAGLLSAVSLPMGTLTTLFWKPKEKVIGFLMAFGGGALLAALAFDLVDAAVEKGHFYILAAGCILGGLLFDGLNYMIGKKGGFLRKSSTTLQYLKEKRRQRVLGLIKQINGADIFRNLPTREAQELVMACKEHRYTKDTILFEANDPAERLYLVRSGEVRELDPASNKDTVTSPMDLVGTMAFFTNSPHTYEARTSGQTRLFSLSLSNFERLLAHCPVLKDAFVRFLSRDAVNTYLVDQLHLDPTDAQTWVGDAVTSVRWDNDIPHAVKIRRKRKAFIRFVDDLEELTFFSKLTADEIRQIAERVYLVTCKKGHTFYYVNDGAQRLFIIKQGCVSLYDPNLKTHVPRVRGPQENFGLGALLTGSPHSVTAVAKEDTQVWVLRKKDFEYLLAHLPNLKTALSEFLREPMIDSYLRQQHSVDSQSANDWVDKAVKALDNGQHLPSAAMINASGDTGKSAPIAIWLGILLDGIPESLVIGSSMLHGSVSISLIVGLFLSNYPEALSSSVGMRQQGMPFMRVFWMWTSLMVMTGIGAAAGQMFFQGVPTAVFSFTGGIAAGSMLTMIAETMLPEAYHKGGTISGIATLLGFLVAIFFTTIGHGH